MFTDLEITNELALRLIDARNAEELFALVEKNRSHLRRWLPWLDFNTSVDDSSSFVQDSALRAEARKGAVYEIREHHTLIGIAGYNQIEALSRKCEIGYWIDETQQGKGIVTKCTAELVRFAFESLEMNKVSIPVAVKNSASRAIPEKLGFSIEGISRDAEWLYDHYVDHVLYALLRRDWQASG